MPSISRTARKATSKVGSIASSTSSSSEFIEPTPFGVTAGAESAPEASGSTKVSGIAY
jgi:hypothetical protein